MRKKKRKMARVLIGARTDVLEAAGVREEKLGWFVVILL